MAFQRILQLVWSLHILIICVVAEITIKPISDLTVANGDEVTIDCVFENLTPSSQVFFFIYHHDSVVSFNDDLTPPVPRYHLDTSQFGRWRLIIATARLEDEGAWRCQLQAPNTAVSVMMLTVLTAPNITSISPTQTPEVGSTVVLSCNATGSPQPTIRWYKTQPVSDQGYVSGSTFVLEDIQPSARGLYKCRASNGDATATGTVFIQMEYSPVVTAVTRSVSAPLGEAAMLECLCEAYPAVTTVGSVTWERDGTAININDGYQVSVMLQPDQFRETSISTLVVAAVDEASLGMYTCQFENKKGRAEDEVDLKEGKIVDPETGKSISGAPSVMATLATIMVALATTMTTITVTSSLVLS